MSAREFLPFALEEDDDIVVRHAQASEAMSLLGEQLPMPQLADHADALMARAIEPLVSVDELVMSVPTTSIPHFAALEDLLGKAIVEARAGHFLSPPTQPEIEEMRQWLSQEVRRQPEGDTTSPTALAPLGYDRAEQLVGRRVIEVRPLRLDEDHRVFVARFHPV